LALSRTSLPLKGGDTMSKAKLLVRLSGLAAFLAVLGGGFVDGG
jgi:hypothetical protein